MKTLTLGDAKYEVVDEQARIDIRQLNTKVEQAQTDIEQIGVDIGEKTEKSIQELDNKKVNISNAKIVGSLSMGRDTNATIGENSTALGDGAIAQTNGSVAFGTNTIAGALGYFITAIYSLNSTTQAIVLSEQQVKNNPPSDKRDTHEGDTEEIPVITKSIKDVAAGQDIYIICPNNHYTFCGKTVQVMRKGLDFNVDALQVTNLKLYDEAYGTDDYIMNFEEFVDHYKVANALDDNFSGTFADVLATGKIVGARDYMVVIPQDPTWGVCEAAEAGYAEGKNTKATGDYTHAEGRDTVTGGPYAHVEGRGTKAGYASHAEGRDTFAKGRYSHAEGQNTKSLGHSSHAEGEGSTSSGYRSHAEGGGTNAIGLGSHAEGNYTIASSESSHAEGKETKASGYASHSEGKETIASGECAHAEGCDAKASGHESHAEGSHTTASAYCAHAEGLDTTASGLASHAEGNNTTAYGESSHAEGVLTEAGYAAHAEGHSSKATGYYSHAEGQNCKTVGSCTHAEGNGTTAEGWASHAEGAGTKALGAETHAEGCGTNATGNYQHVQGKYNLIDTGSNYLHIVGNGGSDTERSNAHTVDWQGKGWYKGSITSNGADYAEYFEWADGNPDKEDRVGLLVTLDGECMKVANVDDEVLGIISGTVAVLGDNYECEWKNKYLMDDFGRILYEKVEESLGFFEYPIINPDYNPDQEYINRANRPEWDAVGLVGKLYLRDDGTCQVNQYATTGANGVATASTEKTNIRVLSRVNDNIVKVLLK